MNNEINDSVEVKTTSSNKKILFILLGFLLVLLLIYGVFLVQHKFKIFGGCTTKCECVNKVETVDEFETTGSNKTVTIEKVEFGAVDEKDGKTYTKIKTSFTNNTDKETNMNVYWFQLADDDRQTIATCHSEATFKGTEKGDILPGILPANGTISGYLYCDTDVNDAALLRILYISGVYFEDEVWQHDYKILNITFSESVKGR